MENENVASENSPKKKPWKVILYILVLVLVLGIGLVIGGVFRPTSTSSNDGKTRIAGAVERYAEDQDYSDVTEAASIAIPGYEAFTFVAGKTTQDITLHNPEENTCYFRMSLVLEDGTVIWTSDLLEPGMAFSEIELLEPLSEGSYANVSLKYDCFSLKDMSQLNGAEIKVTINVQ
jgi:hypothetical protein